MADRNRRFTLAAIALPFLLLVGARSVAFAADTSDPCSNPAGCVENGADYYTDVWKTVPTITQWSRARRLA